MFEALFKGVSTLFGLLTIEKSVENPDFIFCSSFQNLRLGAMPQQPRSIQPQMIQVLRKSGFHLLFLIKNLRLGSIQRRPFKVSTPARGPSRACSRAFAPPNVAQGRIVGRDPGQTCGDDRSCMVDGVFHIRSSFASNEISLGSV